MEFSKKFIEKFLSSTFKDISDRNWIATNYWYMIDSKERIQKRLDLFLKEQIAKPNSELVKVARQMRAGTKNFDEVIINILRYVRNRVTYQFDDKNFGKVEYWADSYLTWLTKIGDCDDQNSLIYILGILAGIPNFALWCCIGDTVLPNGSIGGHFWTIYFSPKTGKWHSIDSTYYPDLTSIGKRSLFKLESNKYKSIWFIFNDTFIYKEK